MPARRTSPRSGTRLPVVLVVLLTLGCGLDRGGRGDGEDSGVPELEDPPPSAVADGGAPLPMPEADGGTATPMPEDPYGLEVSGNVVDWTSGAAVIATGVTALGIRPAPVSMVDGARYRMTGIPAFGSFRIKAEATAFTPTISLPVEMGAASTSAVDVPVVPNGIVSTLAGGAEVERMAGRGVLIARLVNGAGATEEGVPLDALSLSPAADGPYALGPSRVVIEDRDDAGAGYIVFFNVLPGLVSPQADPESGFTFEGAAEVQADAVSLAEIRVYGEAPPPVRGASFEDDVLPIFEARGCTACHAGNGDGRQDGGLSLNRSAVLLHDELTEELSPNHGIPRVNLADPEASLVLTMPLREEPADAHPAVIFESTYDPDYLVLLGWILDGAPAN